MSWKETLIQREENFNKILNLAIDKFKDGESVDKLLESINDGSGDQYLFGNLQDIGYTFETYNTYFLFRLHGEYDLDGIWNPNFFESFEGYYEETETNFDDDQVIFDCIKEFLDSESQEYPTSLDTFNYKEVTLSCATQVQGQGGPVSSNLKIFNSKEESDKFYIDNGYLIYTWDGVTRSHSYEELIKLTTDYFKKNKRRYKG